MPTVVAIAPTEKCPADMAALNCLPYLKLAQVWGKLSTTARFDLPVIDEAAEFSARKLAKKLRNLIESGSSYSIDVSTCGADVKKSLAKLMDPANHKGSPESKQLQAEAVKLATII